MKISKKGGSPASNNVVELVSPSAFENLNAMFTNKVTLSGGNCRKNVLANIDLNELSNSKMTVFNKTGGKTKKVVTKAPVKKATSRKNVPKKLVKKGGSTCSTSTSNTGNFLSNFANNIINDTQSASSFPPATLPSRSSSSLDMGAIPDSQMMLATQDISTMSPIIKQTAFPAIDVYKGSFALGGAKKTKKKSSAKQAKPAKTTKPKGKKM